MSKDKQKVEESSPEIEIEQLSREVEIKKFIKIMKEKDKFNFNKEMLSYNMVINGRWGDGKTTFLNQIKKYIKNNPNIGIDLNNIVTISAWDYDFLDNPIEMIWDILDKNKNPLLDAISEIVLPFLKGWSKAWLKELFKNSKHYKYLNEGIKEVKNKKIQENKKRQNILYYKDLKIKIQKCFENNNYGDVYIFIDDLDRCNPNFTIKLFEVLKHIFNIKNIVIIYMLDLESINKSIMNYYHLPISKNNDVNENYLSKIIDYVHDLDKIDETKYLLNKYGLFLFKNLKDLKYLQPPYLNISNYKYYENILKMLEEKSFREQEKIIFKFAKINKILNKERNNSNKTIEDLTLYLITLFFIEYLCSKNILNSANMFKKIDDGIKSTSHTELPILAKYINIFFIKLYKDLDLEEYFESVNIVENLNFINDDFLNLIKKCC